MERRWLCVVYARIIYQMLELSKCINGGNIITRKTRINLLNEKRLFIPWKFWVRIWSMNFCTRFLRLLMLPWLRERERERLQIAIFWLGWLARLKWQASGYDESWQHSRTLTGHDPCLPGQPALGLSCRFPVALLWNTSFHTQHIPFLRLVSWSISFR